MSGSGHHASHSLRNYIVMTTLIVGGIFILLLMNNTNEGGLTSAVIESAKNASLQNLLNENNNQDEETTNIQEAPAVKNSNEVDFMLLTETIPRVTKTVKSEKLQVRTNDVTAKINVNGDRLELSNTDEVTLGLEEFSGKIEFDQNGLSLDGKSRKIEVNGISLSTSKEIEISFDGLDYETVSFVDLDLNIVDFVSGDGKLEIAEKLNYELEKGQEITIYDYEGDLMLSKEADSHAIFEGTSNGIDVIGGSFNLNLR